MRVALLLIAAFAGAVALGLFFLWPAPDEAAEEGALPLYLGDEDGGSDDWAEGQPFGPGPTVCSMDPRYRPKPGMAETCPVIP